MGRTSRKRQKKKLNMQKLKSEENDVTNVLKYWLFKNSCSTSNFIPTNFPITGRGLRAIRNIKENEILIKLPIKMLITTLTVSESNVRILFSKDQSYNAQHILSVFLIYEDHLGTSSKWYPYINSLPQYFSTPEFCTSKEKKLLPNFIQKQIYNVHNIVRHFCFLKRSIETLKEKEQNYCSHCNIPLETIMTFNKYKWAYYVVNTRSVYINEKEIQDNLIKTESPNNLALAPFLDLFNHDMNASVSVSLIVDEYKDKFYQLSTLKPFKKDSQVFINYGPHNSLKLYIDYGFFIPNNPLDQVVFNIFDIQSCVKISKHGLKFIVSNKFNEDMAFTRDGLNYNAINTLFIASTVLEKDCWNIKVYGASFSSEDHIKIYSLGVQILHLKKNEYLSYLNSMNYIKTCSQSFLNAISLIKEHIQILDESLTKLI